MQAGRMAWRARGCWELGIRLGAAACFDPSCSTPVPAAAAQVCRVDVQRPADCRGPQVSRGLAAARHLSVRRAQGPAGAGRQAGRAGHQGEAPLERGRAGAAERCALSAMSCHPFSPPCRRGLHPGWRRAQDETRLKIICLLTEGPPVEGGTEKERFVNIAMQNGINSTRQAATAPRPGGQPCTHSLSMQSAAVACPCCPHSALCPALHTVPGRAQAALFMWEECQRAVEGGSLRVIFEGVVVVVRAPGLHACMHAGRRCRRALAADCRHAPPPPPTGAVPRAAALLPAGHAGGGAARRPAGARGARGGDQREARGHGVPQQAPALLPRALAGPVPRAMQCSTPSSAQHMMRTVSFVLVGAYRCPPCECACSCANPRVLCCLNPETQHGPALGESLAGRAGRRRRREENRHLVAGRCLFWSRQASQPACCKS